MNKKRMNIDLRQRLANRPLAMASRAVDAVMANVMFGDVQTSSSDRPGWELTDGGVAVLPVMGPLLQRGGMLSDFLGITTYDDIADAAESAFVLPNVRGVLMEIDSPGGEVAGLFDLVDYLAALKASYGKPLWAVARDQALSAAYAIASVADRIIVTQTGEAGSVGVIAIHVDESAEDQMEGEKYSLIYAGAKKADGSRHIPLSPSAASDIQADVDDIYTKFVAHVAKARRLTPQAVTATEAAVYRGQHAIDVRFADQIGTLEGAHADLVASLDQPLARSAAPKPNPKTSQSPERNRQMAPQKKLRTPVEKATPDQTVVPAAEKPAAAPKPAAAIVQTTVMPPAQTPQETTAAAGTAPGPVVFAHNAPAGETAASIRAEAAEIAAIAAQAARLGVSVDVAAAVTDGTSPDVLRAAVLTQLAAQSDAAKVVPIAPVPVENTVAVGGSKLVAAAKAEAKQA